MTDRPGEPIDFTALAVGVIAGLMALAIVLILAWG